jgi:hypothetical protein
MGDLKRFSNNKALADETRQLDSLSFKDRINKNKKFHLAYQNVKVRNRRSDEKSEVTSDEKDSSKYDNHKIQHLEKHEETYYPQTFSIEGDKVNEKRGVVRFNYTKNDFYNKYFLHIR